MVLTQVLPRDGSFGTTISLLSPIEFYITPVHLLLWERKFKLKKRTGECSASPCSFACCPSLSSQIQGSLVVQIIGTAMTEHCSREEKRAAGAENYLAELYRCCDRS